MCLEYLAKVLYRQLKTKHHRGVKTVKFIPRTFFLCFLLHNRCTIGPPIILLGPEESKCSNKCPQLLHFSIQWSNKKQELVKNGKCCQDNFCWWFVPLNKCLVLSSAIWFVEFLLLVNKGGCSWSSTFYQNICCSILLCNVTKSSKEAVAHPT